jgi:hypothetical protein
MGSTHIDQALAEMRAELLEVEESAKMLRDGIAALEMLQQRRVGGVDAGSAQPSTPSSTDTTEPTPEPPAEIDPTAPRGSEAVEMILEDYEPGEWVSLQQLVDEFKERRWGPESNNPREAVRANAYRLVKHKGDEYEGGRGKYRRRPPPEASSVFNLGGGDEDQEGVMGDRSAAEAV